MSVGYFITVTNGPADPDEPGWRLEGLPEGTWTFTPNFAATPVDAVSEVSTPEEL